MGETPRLSIGEVSTLEYGTNATAELSGTLENPVLSLGIPSGYTPARGVDYWLDTTLQTIQAGTYTDSTGTITI